MLQDGNLKGEGKIRELTGNELAEDRVGHQVPGKSF